MLFPDITVLHVGTWKNPRNITSTKIRFLDRYELEYHMGKGTAIINGVPYQFSPGTFVLVRPGDLRCSIFDPNEPTKTQFIRFKIIDDPTSRLTTMIDNIPAFCVATEETQMLWKKFRQFYLKSPNSEYKFQYTTMLLGMLMLFSDGALSSSPTERSSHQQALFKAVCYMREHISENVTVTDIATHIGYSTTHFNHLFRLYVKDTPYSYYNSLKIEKAKQLLVNSTKSVSEISEYLAYSNTSKFIRAFKRECNVTPGQFRRNPNAYITDIG